MGKSSNYLPHEDFEPEATSLVALVVGRTAPDDVTDELHQRGWDVRHCRGPRAGGCPLLAGHDCPMRARSDGAIVYVDATDIDETSASGLVRCASHESSPAIAVLAGDPTVLDLLERTPSFFAGESPAVLADAMDEAHAAAFETQGFQCPGGRRAMWVNGSV